MKRLIVVICISALVAGCGLKRPLVLPDHDKKHETDTSSQNTTTEQSPPIMPVAPQQ